LSFFVDHSYNISILHTLPGLLPSGLFIGMLFIVVFQIAALTAQKAGVAITSIAGKMSMVIPIIAGILLYGDKITTQRVLGMTLAIVAVVLSSFKSNKADSQKETHGNLTWLLPLLLFIGSGMVDTSIKWSQHHHMNGQNNGFYFSLLFGSAGLIGVVWSIWRRITQAKRIEH
jgi:drug/metabolite transporter (DMT)-like permease